MSEQFHHYCECWFWKNWGYPTRPYNWQEILEFWDDYEDVKGDENFDNDLHLCSLQNSPSDEFRGSPTEELQEQWNFENNGEDYWDETEEYDFKVPQFHDRINWEKYESYWEPHEYWFEEEYWDDEREYFWDHEAYWEISEALDENKYFYEDYLEN